MVATAGGYLSDEQVQELLATDHKAGFIQFCGCDPTAGDRRRHAEAVAFLELMSWVFQQIMEIREDTDINYQMTVAHNLLVALKEYTGFVEYARKHSLHRGEVQLRRHALTETVKAARQGLWGWSGSVHDLDTGDLVSCHIIVPDQQTCFDEFQALPETRYFFHLFKQLSLSV